MLELFFASVITALIVLFFTRTLIKWNIPDKYEWKRKDWMPEKFCFWCFHFWSSVFVGIALSIIFSFSLFNVIIIAPISTVIATQLLWER